MMMAPPRMPAAARESTAIGSLRRVSSRMTCGMPGRSFSATASVASGVTSRGDTPVPPVVSTRFTPAAAAEEEEVHSARLASIAPRSSGTTAVASTASEKAPVCSPYCRRHATASGPDSSSYTPAEARSLTVRTAARTCTAGAAPAPSAGAAQAAALAASSSAGVQHTLERPPVPAAAGTSGAAPASDTSTGAFGGVCFAC
mmetsp:Transcript_4217/g.14669  ORF Transcript_4217/g.14669 Transcript_4217/m.14669 type:complete len:201 (+) Transcript_4217:160-762(+)